MPNDRIRIVHINLARGYRGGERQTQLLIEALAEFGWRQRLVARRGEPLVLVGGGRDEARLKEAATGLINVVFAGQVADVGSYLAAFDAFIYPSRHEGLGSILLDALEFGLPIVATNVGGIPEIVEDGVNGFLCEPDAIETLTGAVLRFYREPELRRRVGESNKNKASNFSPAQMANRYMEIYDRLTRAPIRKQTA